jgi:Ca2+-binding EF-hand superfamily protein
MSLEVKTNHRQAFKEIFNLVAKDGKIDKKGLEDLFRTIDYKITEEQFNEMVQKIFAKKEQIGFEDFLKIFNLKLTDYTFNDVTNAFRLLAKDDDKYIPLDKIKKILMKNGLSEQEVEFLIH